VPGKAHSVAARVEPEMKWQRDVKATSETIQRISPRLQRIVALGRTMRLNQGVPMDQMRAQRRNVDVDVDTVVVDLLANVCGLCWTHGRRT
jgi:hypothetical protein